MCPFRRVELLNPGLFLCRSIVGMSCDRPDNRDAIYSCSSHRTRWIVDDPTWTWPWHEGSSQEFWSRCLCRAELVQNSDFLSKYPPEVSQFKSGVLSTCEIHEALFHFTSGDGRLMNSFLTLSPWLADLTKFSSPCYDIGIGGVNIPPPPNDHAKLFNEHFCNFSKTIESQREKSVNERVDSVTFFILDHWYRVFHEFMSIGPWNRQPTCEIGVSNITQGVELSRSMKETQITNPWK
jgi:hypothetical protein